MILATDDFNRANNADLGALWDTMTGNSALKILSNAAAPVNISVDCAETYNGITWPDDQYSRGRFTLDAAAGASGGPGLLVRGAVGVETLYYLTASHTGDTVLVKVVAGISTVLANSPIGFTDGDVFSLEIVGVSLRVFARGGHYAAFDVDDAEILTGSAGVFYKPAAGAAFASIDDWEGGVPDSAYGSRDWSNFPKVLLQKPLGVR